MVLLDLLSLLNLSIVGLRSVMDELASHSVWAVSVGTVFLAQFGLIKNGHIRLDHHVSFSMSERALISKFAFPVELECLAQFCAELVYVWRGWSELIING